MLKPSHGRNGSLSECQKEVQTLFDNEEIQLEKAEEYFHSKTSPKVQDVSELFSFNDSSFLYRFFFFASNYDTRVATKKKMHPWQEPSFLASKGLLILCVICIILHTLPHYLNISNTNVFIDESYGIVDNPDTYNLSSFWRLWDRDFWGTKMRTEDKSSHKSYRPLVVLSFLLQRVWAHDSGIPGFLQSARLLNSLIHTLNSLLLFFFQTHSLHLPIGLSFLSSTIFAAHPIHTENVVYLVGRCDSLSLLFSQLSLFLYFLFFSPWKTLPFSSFLYTPLRGPITPLPPFKTLSPINKTGQNYRNLALFLIGPTILAGLSKETGLLLPAFFIGVECLFPFPRITHILQYLLLQIILLYLRFLIVGGGDVSFSPLDTPHAYITDPLRRSLSYLQIVVKYFQLLVWPVTQSWDYSANALPLASGISDRRNLAVLFLFSLFALLIFTGLRALLRERAQLTQALRLYHVSGWLQRSEEKGEETKDPANNATRRETVNEKRGGEEREEIGADIKSEASNVRGEKSKLVQREDVTIRRRKKGDETASSEPRENKGSSANDRTLEENFSNTDIKRTASREETWLMGTISGGTAFLIGLGFLVVTFLPASNLFLTVGTVIGERLLYIPSYGYAILLCGLIKLIFDETRKMRTSFGRQMHKYLMPLILVGLTFMDINFLMKCVARNYSWMSHQNLYLGDAVNYPNSSKIQFMAATVYLQQNLLPEALTHFQLSKQIYSQNALTDYFILKVLLELDRLDECKEIVEEMIEKNQWTGFGLNNIHLVMGEIGNYFLRVSEEEKAKKYFVLGIERSQSGICLKCQNGLAYYHLIKKNYTLAVEYLSHSLRTNPEAYLFYNLSIIFLAHQDFTQSEIFLTRYIEWDREVRKVFEELQIDYDNKGSMENVEKIQKKILEKGNLTPEEIDALYDKKSPKILSRSSKIAKKETKRSH